MDGELPGSSQGTSRADVAEFQGIYGTFEFPERLLQKIWNLGFFLRDRLNTTDGRSVEIVEAGTWNRVGGGPDFRDAVLRIGGIAVRGDIEMHFHPRDWRNHGHSRNPAFDNVVLHVSLFAPDAGSPVAHTSKGDAIPLLVLLPHLTCSIEEFALDDALEQVTGASARTGLADFMRGRSVGELMADLGRLARTRWDQKVGFARLRIERLGWEAACHQTALEILGYRHNRAPMLAVAEQYPLATWTDGGPGLERLLRAAAGRWRVVGVRPANHPRLRLAQYAAWTRAVPGWPDRVANLRGWIPEIPAGSPFAAIKTARRGGITRARDRVAIEIVGSAVSGTRLDTIVTNGLLPLLAANRGPDLFPAWCCWFAGDSPDWLKAALRGVPAGAGRRLPLCEGLLQAVLQVSLEQPASNSLLGSARRES